MREASRRRLEIYPFQADRGLGSRGVFIGREVLGGRGFVFTIRGACTRTRLPDIISQFLEFWALGRAAWLRRTARVS